jgi:hypothetical protein
MPVTLCALWAGAVAELAHLGPSLVLSLLFLAVKMTHPLLGAALSLPTVLWAGTFQTLPIALSCQWRRAAWLVEPECR